MCLSRITETYDTPSTVITDGRKQFSGSDTKPEFSSFTLNGKKSVPLDQWIAAETAEKVRASDGNYYEAGFHVYEEDTNEMNKAPYRRVFVRCVSARGDEGYSKKVLIAREMFVPSDQNGWPPKPGDPSPAKKDKPGLLDRLKGSAAKPGNA